MLKAYGLQTHIWNNNLRSVILLCAFPFLLLVLAFAISLLWTSFTSEAMPDQALAYSVNQMPRVAPIVFGGAGVWFVIAFLGHQAMIDAATGAKRASPSGEKRAYLMLENLCISRGMTTPRLKVIETPVMNAFASGIRDRNYAVTLTRGLMDNLEDDELEAVIAHELSHIRHKDVRVLIISIIFVGIFAFVGEGVVRNMFRVNLARSSTHRRSGGGQAGAMVFFAMALIAITYFFALLVRFSLSRKREYMADAGAVELTKNPDAMIRALQKISGKADLAAPAEVLEMAIENPRTGFAGMFATHPPIEKRIAALVEYAGGNVGTQSRVERSEMRTQQASFGESSFVKPASKKFGKRSKVGFKSPWDPKP